MFKPLQAYSGCGGFFYLYKISGWNFDKNGAMKKMILILSVVAMPSLLAAQGKIPKLNKQIIEYVNSVMGTKVERGECWDLVHVPFDKYNADWDHSFNFGN